jgi:hypothetical protein
MSKHLGILISIVLLSLAVTAQEKTVDDQAGKRPDFSGTWVLDEEKSYSKSEDRENMDKYQMIIKHSGEEIEIFRTYVFKNRNNRYTEILYTDKRGEKNLDTSGASSKSEISSKTTWKKQTIVRKYQAVREIFGGSPIYVLSKQIFKLSKDRLVLEITTEFVLNSVSNEIARATIRQNGFSAPKYKLIFNRQE